MKRLSFAGLCRLMVVAMLVSCGSDDGPAPGGNPGIAGSAPWMSDAGAGGTGAEPGECGAGMFGCGSGECVRDVLFCDGTSDCADGSDEECTPLEPFGLLVEAVQLSTSRDWDVLGNQPDPYVCVEAGGASACTPSCSDVYDCSWNIPLELRVQPPATLTVSVYDDDVDAADPAGETTVEVTEYRAGDEQSWTLTFGEVDRLTLRTVP